MIEPTLPSGLELGTSPVGALVGRRVGPWELVDEIGRGGMGIVYRAVRTDGLFEKDVAIKLLRPEADTGFSPERFERERRILAGLSHPHIASLLDAGMTDDGLPVLIMEYVPGQPIDVACDRTGLGLRERMGLIRQVCSAVHYAHQRLVIHRDIKPANILVTADGIPKLLDFGIAKLLSPEGGAAATPTATHTRAMTLEYASPEQVRGETVTTASDVYALGVLAYRLLAGRSPYQGHSSSVAELVTAICDQDPERPSSVPRLAPPAQVAGERGPAQAPAPPAWRAALRGDVDRIVLRAMRKEPTERYDSAKALGEDIGRYLAGQPVHAHTASLAYIVGKRLRRHRAASIVTVVALAVGMVAAGLGMQARRVAGQRIRLAQELGGAVERMEWVMRVAHLLPLHDIRFEKAQVLESMAWIEGRMQALGAVADAPGHAALGRGLLSLGRFEEARSHLDLAWTGGLRQSEVAQALGLALANRYWQEKLVTDRMSTPEARRAKRTADEVGFRDPALTLLRQAGACGGASEYILGLIARLEGRPEEGIRRAQVAAAQVPWLYEARLLEGECWMEIANVCRERGDAAGDTDATVRAEAAFNVAARLAPSDPRTHIRALFLAKIGLQRLTFQTIGEAAPHLAQAEASAQAAITADPENPETCRHLAETYCVHATWAIRMGRDPLPSVRRAIEVAERGATLQPLLANTLAALATAHALQGQFEAGHGQDPRPALARAMEAYRRAGQVEADNLQVLIGQGNAARFLAEYQITHGEDPRPALREAGECYQRAIALVPDAPNFFNNQGIVYQVMATFELGHGADPAASLAEAIRCHRRALALNPNHAFAANNLGNDLNVKALFEMAVGSDPEASFRDAEAVFRDTARLAPQDAVCHTNLIYLYRFRAEHERRSGRDPTLWQSAAEQSFQTALRLNSTIAESFTFMSGFELVLAHAALEAGRSPMANIARARAALPKALAIDPASAEARQLAGRAAVIEARWRTVARQPSAAAFEVAARELEQASRSNPDDATIWRDLAELHRWHAEALQTAPTGTHAAARAEIEQGLAAAARALAVNPSLAEALLTRGALHALAAAVAPDAAQATGARQLARDDLGAALGLNAHLRREVETLRAALS